MSHKMSLEKLGEVLGDLERYKKLNQTTADRLQESRNKKLEEEAVSNSLAYQLTLMSLQIEQGKKEVSNLEENQRRLVNLSLELVRSAKMLRNHSAVNKLRMDIKEQKLAILQGEAQSVDFALEVQMN